MVIIMASESKFKKVCPVLLGNILQAYDFCIYGLLAPVFAKIFFPPDFKYSLIAAFFLFAMAYLMRPLGAFFWGGIADHYGRKPVLIITVSLMVVTSLIMTIIPSYAQIGITSTCIVIFFRLIQGFAFGGEFPTSVVNVYEISESKKKGFFSSLANAFAVFGYLISMLLMLLMNLMLTEDQIINFGWRILFLISVIFLIFLGFLRFKLIETKSNITNKKLDFINNLDVKNILIIFLYLLAGQCLFSNLVFYNHLLVNDSLKQSSFLSIIHISSILFQVCVLIIIGFFSDKINRLSFVRILHICIILCCIPIYKLLLSNSFCLLIIAYLLVIVFSGMSAGVAMPIIVGHAKKISRVSTIAIPYNLSGIFYAFVPTVNESLIKITQIKYSPAFFLIFCVLISFGASFFIKNSRNIE